MPRRTAADAARTRSDIVKAARRLFASRGFAGTTTSEIADAAGVTVGALFHHFEGKAGLFRSVFHDLEAELDAYVRDVSGKAGGPEAGLVAFLAGFRAYLEFAMRKDFHRIVMIEGRVVLGEDEWHAIDVRQGATTLMEGLEHLKAQGLIDDRPLRPLALLLLGAMSEAGFTVARARSRDLIEPLVDAMRYLLTAHLTAGAAAPTPAPPTAPAGVRARRPSRKAR